MTSYLFEAHDGDTAIAYAYGNFAIVSKAVSETFPKGFEAGTDEVTVKLAEVDGVHGSQLGRAIVSLTADFESVNDVLARRLSALRKTDPDVPARKPRKAKTEGEADQGTDVPAGVSQY